MLHLRLQRGITPKTPFGGTDVDSRWARDRTEPPAMTAPGGARKVEAPVPFTRIQRMGTKTIRLDDEIYERIRAEKREDETFSETIERLIGDVSLLELAGGLSEAEAEEAKATIRTSRQVDRQKAQNIGRRSTELEE